ncbi:MAG: chorismate mutase [Patescibacteria group bacterium]
MQNLDQIRGKIDKIDQKLDMLLQKRANLVFKLKKIKKIAKIPVEDKKREAEILSKFDSKYVKTVFKTILSASKILQKSPNKTLKK